LRFRQIRYACQQVFEDSTNEGYSPFVPLLIKPDMNKQYRVTVTPLLHEKASYSPPDYHLKGAI